MEWLVNKDNDNDNDNGNDNDSDSDNDSKRFKGSSVEESRTPFKKIPELVRISFYNCTVL